MKKIFSTALFLTFLIAGSVEAVQIHKVDKKEIFRTFEIKPFTFDPEIIKGKDLIETRAILSELILEHHIENLLKFSLYAGLPQSFAKDEMTEARFKVFNIFLRKNKLEDYHDPKIAQDIDEGMRETIESFINRPHVDNYYDLKEVISRVNDQKLAAQVVGSESDRQALAKPAVAVETTFLGIPKATTQNIAVLALVLAALSLFKSLSPSNQRKR